MSEAGRRVSFYDPAACAAWDRLVDASPNGTVLQSRRFLDYHGDRFKDLSLLMHEADGSLAGVFPVAAHLSAASIAVSHAGSSFGGIVMSRPDFGIETEFLHRAAQMLLGEGFHTLVYRCPPPFVHGLPGDGLMPLLLRHGRIQQCDLWAVLPLPGPARNRKFWRRRLLRGQRDGLTVVRVESAADWESFHGVLQAELKRRHGVPPVHSAAELIDLHRRLGAQSWALRVLSPDGATCAVLWFIDYGKGTLHNQYVASTEEGRLLGAVSFAFGSILEEALNRGFRQFSFGRSTEADGWSVNASLLHFKQQFGSGLSAQLHIEVPLDALIKPS